MGGPSETQSPEGTHLEWLEHYWAKRLKEEDSLSVAKDIARRQVELELKAIKDPLTGAFNRRYLEETLAWEMRAAPFLGQHPGIAFVDIDDFKQVNDKDPRKHKAGDDALVVLVNQMREAVGVNGIVCRWGGEEFLILFLNTDMEKMKKIATGLEAKIKNDLVRDAHLQVPGMPVVSVSMGLTVAREGEQPLEFIHRADGLMYSAKKAGKSRISYTGADGQTETIQL